MGRASSESETAVEPAEMPLKDVVPPRAVLTELARGFLMMHESDPNRAARFAATFLKERAGPPPPPRIVPVGTRANVRRGIVSALREPPP